MAWDTKSHIEPKNLFCLNGYWHGYTVVRIKIWPPFAADCKEAVAWCQGRFLVGPEIDLWVSTCGAFYTWLGQHRRPQKPNNCTATEVSVFGAEVQHAIPWSLASHTILRVFQWWAISSMVQAGYFRRAREFQDTPVSTVVQHPVAGRLPRLIGR